MSAGFIKRKIKLDPSLGEIFKTARENKKITLIEAETGSKVRAKYLSAIENSNWKLLPGEVYARGFVLAYAKYLELETKEILPLYEKEAGILSGKKMVDLSYINSSTNPKVLVTPKLLAYSAVSVVVCLMFAYIIYQVAGFAGSPNLRIVNPANNVVLENDTVELAGVTDTDALIMVNNEQVPVTNDGHFNLSLKLQHRGVNVIKVQAINKAKKESSEVYTVEYRPRTAAISENGGSGEL